MITKDNVKDVILENKRLLPEIKEKISIIQSHGNALTHLKPLEFIKHHLNKHTKVILYPSKDKEYGGLVRYKNGRFYIHINTLQPKVYENFIWAHEFYHYFFEKDQIKDREHNTFIDDSVLNEHERRPNLFASEILINEYAFKEMFAAVRGEYSKEPLEKQVMRMIPTFELPYKVIVIKLAQENLITIDQAIDIIDFDYKKNIPSDFDLSYLRPSYVIKIDHIEDLLLEAEQKNVLSHENLETFKNAFYKKLEEVQVLRETP